MPLYRSNTPSHGIAFSLSAVWQLKVLKIVTKNLADPAKARDEKYRQLRLDNEKIRQKLVPCNPHATLYLECLGFVEHADEQVLRVAAATVNLVSTQAALEEVSRALEGLASLEQQQPPAPAESKKPKLDQASSFEEKLSEKQKARRLLEEKERAEKDEARRRRKVTSAQIKQDAYVRKHDENWTSGPSAAVHKAGTAISTFRDRHGEN